MPMCELTTTSNEFYKWPDDEQAAFWRWVVALKDHDNPIGDFIRDTRVAINVGSGEPYQAIYRADEVVRRIHGTLMRRYIRMVHEGKAR